MERGPTPPPMDPTSDEASAEQLDLARAQGDAYGAAVRLMTGSVADDGSEQRVGEYLIGYAVERAEGMYEAGTEGLEWRPPGDANLHVEVTVRDGSDGRFVPGVRVLVTLTDPSGIDLGTEELPMVWHPMLLHYGRNWTVPADGVYAMKVRVEPPAFPRHDRVNGRRFTQPAECTFSAVRLNRGSAEG